MSGLHFKISGEKTSRLLIQKAKTFYAKEKHLKINFDEIAALYRVSGGDARKLYNAIELIVGSFPSYQKEIDVDNGLVSKLIQKNLSIYDKKGEMHYDVISAFIKSIRGSDPNAAVYYLARMIEGGKM
jgi:putative ATPase